jgi:hypothetical protein
MREEVSGFLAMGVTWRRAALSTMPAGPAFYENRPQVIGREK